MHDLFADSFETGLLGQERDEPVHFAVNLDAFDHLVAVGFQAAVEVVQLDSGSQPRRAVEEFTRQRLPDRIEPALFPSADQVVSLFGNHPVQFRDFVRRVLQIGVHRDHDVAPGRFEAAVESGRFPVIAPEPDGPDARIGVVQRADHFPRAVVAAVVHEDDFVREAVLRHHPLDPCEQFGQRFLLVVQRDDYRDVRIVF